MAWNGMEAVATLTVLLSTVQHAQPVWGVRFDTLWCRAGCAVMNILCSSCAIAAVEYQ
jgi:hypothetical protein